MAESLGPVLAMAGVTLFNSVIVHHQSIDHQYNIVVAGAVVAGGLALLERLSPDLAVGLAWLGLVTVLLVRVQPNVPAPLESIVAWYNEK